MFGELIALLAVFFGIHLFALVKCIEFEVSRRWRELVTI